MDLNKNLQKMNSGIRKLKIPINVDHVFDYRDLFEYTLARGFVPEPYLSSSRYSIRAGQDNGENFITYMATFLKYKRDLNILPGFVHLVYNTRSGGRDVETHINNTVKMLIKMGYEMEELNLIIAYPLLVQKCIDLGFNVTVSSASVLAYKRIIDILIKCPIPLPESVSYVLPSTYQFVIDKVPPDSFELLLNNGCFIGCVNSTVKTDHSKFCPITAKNCNSLYSDEFSKTVDLIRRWKFKSLLQQGWNNFKISGRQATMPLIYDVVRYYLRVENIPYIDNPSSYGTSSNG